MAFTSSGQSPPTPKRAARVGAHAYVASPAHNFASPGHRGRDAGADYVAFGAFFSRPHQERQDRGRPSILEWWSEIATLPSVAIVGITVENCPALVRAGADFLAVVGGVWNHPEGPAAAVRAFNRAIAEADGT